MTHLVASVNLLLGDRPLDEIHITQTTEQAFVVSFDIPLWQRRMKATGQVGIEFIASGKHVSSIGVSLLNYTLATGRMWSVIFFSIDSSSSTATSRKSRKAMNTWHVMISLLESSTPTYFGSQLIVDAVPPLNPELNQAPGPWEARSTELPPLCKEQFQSGSSKYDYNYDGERERHIHDWLEVTTFLLPPSETNITSRPHLHVRHRLAYCGVHPRPHCRVLKHRPRFPFISDAVTANLAVERTQENLRVRT